MYIIYNCSIHLISTAVNSYYHVKCVRNKRVKEALKQRKSVHSTVLKHEHAGNCVLQAHAHITYTQCNTFTHCKHDIIILKSHERCG